MNDSRNFETLLPSPFFYRPPTSFTQHNAVNLVAEGLNAQRNFILNKRFPGNIVIPPGSNSPLILVTSMTEDNQTDTESIGSFGTPSP